MTNRSWHDARMGTDDMKRRLERLGEMVLARREALGLTKEAAARLAKISSITWKKVEEGADGVMGPKHAAISSVLWSDSGAIKDYLNGGPEPVVPEPVEGTQVEDFIATAPDPVVETMLETIRGQHPEWVYQWATRVVDEHRNNRSAANRNRPRTG